MKSLFTILNLFFLAAIAYGLIDTGYKNLIPQNFILSGQEIYNSGAKNKTDGYKKPDIDKKISNVIVKRNLFKVEIEKREPDVTIEKKEQEPETLEKTKLRLVLWGTVTGQENVYAVIEDKKSRKQTLYQIGDLIQGAKLKTILRSRVILFYQGKDQFLEIQTGSKDAPKLSNLKAKTNVEPEIASVDKGFDHEAPDNFDSMMRQIKFRPHFTEGEADGLMVYGIRPNSVFRKIGLRNGDIIKDINGNAIVSKNDISSLFSEVEDPENLKITLSRRGKIKELNYTPFPEENDKGEEK
jgi:general secretion pathway protein C